MFDDEFVKMSALRRFCTEGSLILLKNLFDDEKKYACKYDTSLFSAFSATTDLKISFDIRME